jgi:hypothetical protein
MEVGAIKVELKKLEEGKRRQWVQCWNY